MTFWILNLLLAVFSLALSFAASDTAGGCGFGSFEKYVGRWMFRAENFCIEPVPASDDIVPTCVQRRGKLLNREPDSSRSKSEEATDSAKVGYGGRLRGTRRASFLVPT